MKLAMIGLGRMGGDMTRRLLRGQRHQVVVYDLEASRIGELVPAGAEGASSLQDLVGRLVWPRVLWVMLPAGSATEHTIDALIPLLEKDDIIIDGGNANYKDTLRRAGHLREHGLHLVDVGTSGGVWGLENGYCLMVGGEKDVVDRLRSVFETLAPAPDQGWGYVGRSGAGHFAKMVHNGIEYGLMQAYAEGLEVLHAKQEYDFDLNQITQVWRSGSVIRSWLLDLTASALQKDADLQGVSASVPDSGEGRWMVAEAIELGVPAPAITAALLARVASRQSESYAAKVLVAMRHQFGGHDIAAKSPPEDTSVVVAPRTQCETEPQTGVPAAAPDVNVPSSVASLILLGNVFKPRDRGYISGLLGSIRRRIPGPGVRRKQ